MSISTNIASLHAATTARDRDENTRKRRRDELHKAAIDTRPFTVQPNTLDPFARPRTFTPLCLLSRSQLPLAYLDTAQDGSRQFAAHVHILEASSEHEHDANVLIVEDEKENRIYAIERIHLRRYALCRLASWVKKDHVVNSTKSEIRDDVLRIKRQALETKENELWWTRASTAVNLEALPALRLDVPKLLMSAQRENGLSAADNVQAGAENKIAAQEILGPAPEDPSLAKPAVPEDALQELTKQYLDALYLSRTPLAYFTKGPLARARAALAERSCELVAFLKGAILTSSIFDKKYRVSIPEIIKELPHSETPEMKTKTRRKRKWKSKRDKNGHYSDEKDYVEHWWRKEDDSSHALGSAETLDSVIRRRSQRLRIRETFLQVIVVLEIVSLEATAPSLKESQTSESQAAESQSPATEKKSRKKKDQDIASTLETLIDRLCIWYSLEGSPHTEDTPGGGNAAHDANDDLKSFASDVIIPFFASRIPERAYLTSKKLGGPTAPKLAKNLTAVSTKPGEPATRQVPEKRPRRPLERVSTDTLNRFGKRPPSLHRAATDSDALAPLIKREMSFTPPLDCIPLAKQRKYQPAEGGQRKRVSLLEQMGHGRREIDLSAMIQANAAKMKKRADVEEKLRDAISTLRKPNRDRAVEDIAKNADQSFAQAISRGRSGNAAQQRKTIDKNAVAITATPKLVKATPAPKRQTGSDAGLTRGLAEAPVVLSSSARLLAQPGEFPSSSFAIPQTGHRPRRPNVEDTPSRGFAKFLPVGLAREPGTLGTLLESPTASRMIAVAQTPFSKPPKMQPLREGSLDKPATPQTRLKGRTYSPMKRFDSAPAESQRRDTAAVSEALEGKSDSIYDALGWNDEDYEPLS